MEELSTAGAAALGARTGQVATSDGRLDVQLSRRASTGGDDGPGTERSGS